MRIAKQTQNFSQNRRKTFRVSFAFSFCVGFAVLVFLFSIPGVSAQDNTSIDVSCAQYKYPWCQEEAKNPAGLVAQFYQIALGLAGAAALGVLIYGAILWTVSGAVSSKKDAMEWIAGAIWGLVLLLGAYLILYTINPDLVKLKGPEELIKSIEIAPPTSVAPPSYAATPVKGLSEQEARDRLKAAAIQTKPICMAGQSTNCVNLEGIRDTTINEAVFLASQVGFSNTFITAGTEAGHSVGIYSHGNGYKIDIRPNSTLNSYIMSNFIPAGTRSDGASMYQNPSTGAVYAYENAAQGKDPHWDVLVR